MISLIVAVDKNRGIGKNGKMPWHIPADLARFKKLTTGHLLIMGRKTFESIGMSLPNRTNIIITRDTAFKAEGIIVKSSLEEAINEAKKYGNEEIFVIGGGQIYNQTIGITDKLYLTLVEGEYDVDTYFPDYSVFTKKTYEEKGEDNGFKFKFINLEK